MHIPGNLVIPALEGHVGHPHFWERLMTRRRFIGTTAVVGGAAMTAPLWNSVIAQAAGPVNPKPIPQTFDGSPFHFQLLTSTTEPSGITDFKGWVGGGDLLGTGVGLDTTTGIRTHMWTAIDIRFMTGTYVGVDSQSHHGTFGFV